MKVRYQNEPLRPAGGTDAPNLRRHLKTGSIRVGHTTAEFYLQLGEVTIVLPPQAAARLLADLRSALEDHERRHGVTVTGGGESAGGRRESVPRRVIRELYHSRKVSKKLIMSINAPKEWGAQIVLLKTYPTSTSQDIKRSGTGFAISEDGHIATAYHVIKDAKTVKIHLAKDSFVSARVIHGDPVNDLAVLKIENTTPNFLQIAPIRSIKTGDRVFTIGFPVSSVLGKEAKYTEGVVSSLSGIEGASSLLQITVPVQPRNSGGALVNEKGKVVGIITSTAAILPFIEESGTLPQNVNWAVKADYLKPLIELPKIEEKHLNREQLITHVKKATFFIESE